MTRKDYEMIADVMLHCKRWSDIPNAEAILKDVAERFCEVLKGDNIKFDSEKFLTACGLEA